METGTELDKHLEHLKPYIEEMEITLGWTPLHCIVEQEHFNLAVHLIKEASDVNAYDRFKRTPLSIAAAKGNSKLIELLLEAGADVNNGFPLHFACEKGHSKAIEHLIKKGADVNLEKDNNYPIIIAAAHGNLEVVKYMIASGADVNVVDSDRDTALHWACESGNEELIAFLIDAGCDIDAMDRFEITPLSACLIRMEDKPGLVKLLLEKGASSDLHDKQNYTYLHQSENPVSTLELIKHGANVNAQNDNKETPLYNRTYFKHIDCAKILLQENADPNIPAPGGWTALHLAAYEGDVDYVEELLERKANVDAATAQNIIPLHLAVAKGHLKITKKLLEHGSLVNVPVVDIPDINSIGPYSIDRQWISDGVTPLDLAASSSHWEVCKLLVSYGAEFSDVLSLPSEFAVLQLQSSNKSDWPCNDVIVAVRKNHLDVIRHLPHIDGPQITDLIGWTLLHHAVSKSYVEMASLLIERGSSVNSSDFYGRTPLTIAATQTDLTMIKFLLDAGADANLGLPLHYAADKNSLECILELIQHNCNVNLKNQKDSESPLLVEAALDSKTEVVELLLKNHADPNCCNKWGEVALHHSCKSGDEESVRVLLKYGANVNAVDNFKDTPLHYAAVGKNLEIVKLLLANGANVDAQDILHRFVSCGFEEGAVELMKAGCCIDSRNEEGETSLFLASENVTLLQALIDHHADINITSNNGWTPLHEAAANGNVECVRKLLECGAKVNVALAENVLPIYLASVFGNVEIVKELLHHSSYIDSAILGVGVAALDFGSWPFRKRYHIVAGNTPLIGAASKGHLEVVKLLHSFGASLQSANCEGNTALHAAVVGDFEKIVEFLIGSDVALVNVKNYSGKTAFDLAKERSNEVIMKMTVRK